jgi:uncharacterized PurR-regulated membrane protein YhhQ (DUF165 family)
MKFGFAAVIAYVATIFAANWSIATFGIVPVGFGFVAPAAVYFVGLAFPLRDVIQRTLGRRWSVVAILVGTALSYVVSPQFAIASGVTFLISETCDMLVYTPLAKRFTFAVAASSVTALVVDSILFLTLAFGSLAFLPGQIVGKTWVALVAVVVIKAAQVARPKTATA